MLLLSVVHTVQLITKTNINLNALISWDYIMEI